MARLFKLERALLLEIDKYEKLVTEKRDSPTDWERVHMASCARVGYILALRRGVDPDLAACACAVHDYGRILSGKQNGHAEYGYVPVMAFLRETALFTETEIDDIGIAVRNHSKKAEIGSPLEEIVKDADVLDYSQYGFELPRAEQKERLARLLAEDMQ